jgi:hypothetical protein
MEYVRTMLVVSIDTGVEEGERQVRKLEKIHCMKKEI